MGNQLPVRPDPDPDTDTATNPDTDTDTTQGVDCSEPDLSNVNFDDFEFENIVLEGGGTKGCAYPGVIQVLEETGIWPRIRRLAGTSSGAMAAAFLSVGYDSRGLDDIMSDDISDVFQEHSWGYLSLVPNLLYYFGWNGDTKFYSWLGGIIEKKTGDPDTTFIEVYRRFGRELCIVVTNVNQMKPEFCHPKTTPDMPIRKAVRMSTAIPVYFQPVFFVRYDLEEMFVDGAVVCNYPIKCFDGWWLSMRPDDSFLERMPKLSSVNDIYDDGERFGTYNPLTIGMLLYTGHEREVFKRRLERRAGIVGMEGVPDTVLSKDYKNIRRDHQQIIDEHAALVSAKKELCQTLEVLNVGLKKTFSRRELQAIICKGRISSDAQKTLLESETDLSTIHGTESGKVDFGTLVDHLEQRGLDLQTRYQIKTGVRQIPSFVQFILMINKTMLLHSQRQNVKDSDYSRTVGINTHHVGIIDFTMQDQDKLFLKMQGRRAMKAFLLERWADAQAEKTAGR